MGGGGGGESSVCFTLGGGGGGDQTLICYVWPKLHNENMCSVYGGLYSNIIFMFKMKLKT